MKIIRDLGTVPAKCHECLLTIGKFDGLHAGHAEILRTLTELAQELRLPSVVMTFDPSPLEVLHPKRASAPLSSVHEKIEQIRSYGVDYLLIYPATKEFFQLSAEEFFQTIVLQTFHASGMIEGPTFTFGRRRGGNEERLRDLCKKNGLSLTIVPSIQLLGKKVSSSRIRQLLSEGNVAAAGTLLTRPYRIVGTVSHGDHRGTTLGFPTANISQISNFLPKQGVYAATAFVDHHQFQTALSIGGNPTFGIEEKKIEAFLLNYSGEDLYEKEVTIDFQTRLRDLVAFKSKEALIEQIRIDVQKIKTLS